MENHPLAFTLRNNEALAVRYSPSERRLFQFLPQGSAPSITIDDLAAHYYAALGPPPFNGRTIINGYVNSLMKKARYNDEPFVIKRTRRSGPIASHVWVEAVAARRKRA